MDTPTFGRFVFNWLLEGSDVTEGAEEEDDLVLLVPDWSNLHKEPDRRPCVEDTSHQSGDQRNDAGLEGCEIETLKEEK